MSVVLNTGSEFLSLNNDFRNDATLYGFELYAATSGLIEIMVVNLILYLYRLYVNIIYIKILLFRLLHQVFAVFQFHAQHITINIHLVCH